MNIMNVVTGELCGDIILNFDLIDNSGDLHCGVTEYVEYNSLEDLYQVNTYVSNILAGFTSINEEDEYNVIDLINKYLEDNKQLIFVFNVI